VNFLSRACTEEIELDGIRIPEGTVLCLNMLGAARDPERFEDPHRFDIRRDAGRRVAFGHGLRKCLGDRLARLEMEIGIEVCTTRMTNVHIDGPVELTPWTQGILGPEHLPVTFERR
jgi:cytochrome P450